MNKTLEILPPNVPDYFMYKQKPGRKQDGINISGNKNHIKEFTKEEAEEFGEFMKQTFIKHWEKCNVGT